MTDESKKRRFYAVRHEDDIPQDGKGILIPKITQINNRTKSGTWYRFDFLALLPVLGIFLFLGIGFFWYSNCLINEYGLGTTNFYR